MTTITEAKASTTWSADSMHSTIGFKVKHMMITNITGSFGNYTVEVKTNDQDFSTAKISFSAKVDSITTGVADRDAHLKSDDFFNAEGFPEINFKGSNFSKKNEDTFALTGDLTIRDITKPVTLEVEYSGIGVDPYGQVKAGFAITGKIKRSDFNLKWNAITEAGSIVVSDDIKIVSEVQLIKQA